MNVKIAPQTSVVDTTLIQQVYGNSITVSEGIIALLEKIKIGESFESLRKQFPEGLLYDVLTELLEQGFLVEEDVPMFRTVHPVYCTNLVQETFFGIPLGNLGYDITYSNYKKLNHYGFVGIPYNLGSVTHSIPHNSHSTLRQYSSSVFCVNVNNEGLSNGWYSPSKKKTVGKNLLLKDYGDLEITLNQNLQLERLEKLSEKIAQSNIKPIYIGGDHTLTYPIIKGLLNIYEKIQIIQLDAHADLGVNRWGVVEHGSFMNQLVREEKVHAIYQIGIRGPQESLPYQQNEKIHLFYNNMIEGLNIDSDIPTYITLDVDVFDPSIVPSVGYPVPNGWIYQDYLNVLKEILPSLNLIGLDVVEYNVTFDSGNKLGASTIAHAILDILEGVADNNE